MTQADFLVGLEIFTICIGLYLAFVKSYFEERGKIVATKKDIEEVTQKIEKVKSDIEVLTHKKITLQTEKQNALLDFNSKYTAWLNYILDASIISHTEPANIHSDKINEKLDQYFYDLAISEANIDVFFNSDNELIELKNDIKLKTIGLSNHLKLNLAKAEAEKTQINIVMKFENQIPDNSYKMNLLARHFKQQEEIHIKYQGDKLTIYKSFSSSVYKLAEIISERVHDFFPTLLKDNISV